MIKVSRAVLIGLVILAWFGGFMVGFGTAAPKDYGYTPVNNAFMNDLHNLGISDSDPLYATSVKALVCSEVNADWSENRIHASVVDYFDTDDSTAREVRELVWSYYGC